MMPALTYRADDPGSLFNEPDLSFNHAMDFGPSPAEPPLAGMEFKSAPMPPLHAFRRQYPQYADLDDDDLAERLHAGFYADMPRGEFYAKLGITPQASWGNTAAALPGQGYAALQQGLGGVAQIAFEALSRAPKTPGAARQQLAKNAETAAGIAESGRINAELGVPEGQMSLGQEAALSAANSLALMLPALAAGPSGLPLMLGGVAGQTFSRDRASGLGFKDAVKHTAVETGIEYLTEKSPFQVLTKPGGSLLRRIGGYAATETPGELIATPSQSINDIIFGLRDNPETGEVKTIGDYVKNDLAREEALTALATLMMGAPTVPAAHFLDRARSQPQETQPPAPPPPSQNAAAPAAEAALNQLVAATAVPPPPTGGKANEEAQKGQQGQTLLSQVAAPSATAPPSTDRDIETRFAQQLGADPDAAMRAYEALPGSRGGKILSTDTARELSPDYLADRTRSVAVHEPASWLIKRLYERKLAEAPKGDELPLVLFTAGGTGAGKSTAVNSMDPQRAQIVYDTNMSTYRSAKDKVQAALDAGKNVRIALVIRDPVDALINGALPRAMRQEAKFGSGRTVPLEEHAKTHVGSIDSVKKLAGDRVKVSVIQNVTGQPPRHIELEDVRQLDYNLIMPDLRAALDKAREAGEISESVYRGFAGTDARNAGPPSRLRRAARPSDDRRDQPSTPASDRPGTVKEGEEVTPPEAPEVIAAEQAAAAVPDQVPTGAQTSSQNAAAPAAEPRSEVSDQGRPPVPAAAQTVVATTPTLTNQANRVRSWADEVTRGWANRPTIEVYETAADAGIPEGADGAYVDGRIKLVASRIASPARASKVVLHESFHRGLRTAFRDIGGPQAERQMNSFLDEVWSAYTSGGLRQDGSDYDLRVIGKRYSLDLATQDGQREAAEEYMARLAENEVRSSWLDRLIAMVTRLLRRAAPNLSLSRAEVLDAIAAAQRTNVAPADPARLSARRRQPDLIAGIPRMALRHMRVETARVWVDSERRFESRTVQASDAIMAVREDIETMRTLLSCLQARTA